MGRRKLPNIELKFNKVDIGRTRQRKLLKLLKALDSFRDDEVENIYIDWDKSSIHGLNLYYKKLKHIPIIKEVIKWMVERQEEQSKKEEV